jgi:BMFP domain-containing protein YqiC
MQTDNPVFDGIAKVMTEAAGAADGVRREAETVVKSQVQRLVADMDMVPREEFEAVKEMAANARQENESLRLEIEELGKRLQALETASDA